MTDWRKYSGETSELGMARVPHISTALLASVSTPNGACGGRRPRPRGQGLATAAVRRVRELAAPSMDSAACAQGSRWTIRPRARCWNTMDSSPSLNAGSTASQPFPTSAGTGDVTQSCQCAKIRHLGPSTIQPPSVLLKQNFPGTERRRFSLRELYAVLHVLKHGKSELVAGCAPLLAPG